MKPAKRIYNERCADADFTDTSMTIKIRIFFLTVKLEVIII